MKIQNTEGQASKAQRKYIEQLKRELAVLQIDSIINQHRQRELSALIATIENRG